MTDGRVNVLLVEDDEIDAEYVLRVFEERDIANPVFRALDGVEALEMLRGENGRPQLPRPFVILLDLNMPRMNGVEFLTEIRDDATLCDSVVFVLTTSNAARDRAETNAKQVSGYIVKSNVDDSGSELTSLLDTLADFPSTNTANSRLVRSHDTK